MRKLDYNYVKNFFKENGSKLISKEYKNCEENLDYICVCGREAKSTFSNFKRYKHCYQCGKDIIGDKSRYSYEYIKQYFSDRNCQLLEDSYHDNKQKLKYQCECGNIAYITFAKFQDRNGKLGQRCYDCRNKKIGDLKRLTYQEVYDYFEYEDCKLLSDSYIDANTKLNYQCECGNHAQITFGHFKNGERCKKCAGERRNKFRKFTYEYVKSYFEYNKCKLISNNYYNCDSKLDYICKCGNLSQTTFYQFHKHPRCIQCFYKELSESKRLSYDYVYNYFKKEKYQLITDNYINNLQKLNVICDKGHNIEISFGDFQQGRRCSFCNESLGERKINNYLINNNIIFNKQYRFDNCKNKRSLPFDFAIFNDTNNLQCLVEYDGEYHYIVKDYFGGEDAFEKRQMNDRIKTNYCLLNNIPLLRIPYWEFNNIEKILDEYLLQFGNYKCVNK